MEKFKRYRFIIIIYLLYVVICYFFCGGDGGRMQWDIFRNLVIFLPLLFYLFYWIINYFLALDKWQTFEKTLKEGKEPSSNGSDFLVDTMPLEMFIGKHGSKVGLSSHTNEKTREVFHTLDIISDTGRTISVLFVSTLRDMTIEEIKQRKSELWVGRNRFNNRYYLCDDAFMGWKNVNL